VNLATVLDGHPPERAALVSRRRRTTYGELRAQVDDLRAGLAELGLAAGDRVGIVSANNWFFVVTYFASLGLGAVVVPLNPTSPAAELKSQLGKVRARVLFAGPGARPAVEALSRELVEIEHLLAPESASISGAEPLEAIFVRGAAARATATAAAPAVERDPGDLAALLFTAGTAGSPKAAMLTHGNLMANLHQVQAHPGRAVRQSDVLLGVLPLHHIFGLNMVLNLSLLAGASVVLVERFDPSSALTTVANHRVTLVCGAPAVYKAWLALPDGPGGAPNQGAPAAALFSSVRLAVSGAAPLDPRTAADFEARFGVAIYEGYGLTEASPTVTSSVATGPVKPGSIGVPLTGVEVRLVGQDGEDALVGDSGEIWVRGPNVFAGYWEEPAATAAVLTPDGWLRTGDVAVVDDDGYLFIVDRAKDVINVSGFKVYPAEVEEALAEHPGVAEVAVVGVLHPHSGEAVKAFVVAGEGHHLEEDELIEFCAGHLARYKCPAKVVFVDTLPHTSVGKLRRRDLRSA